MTAPDLAPIHRLAAHPVDRLARHHDVSAATIGRELRAALDAGVDPYVVRAAAWRLDDLADAWAHGMPLDSWPAWTRDVALARAVIAQDAVRLMVAS